MTPQARLNRMIIMAGKYLEPIPYSDRNRDISFSAPARDRAFIQDILEMLEEDR